MRTRLSTRMLLVVAASFIAVSPITAMAKTAPVAEGQPEDPDQRIKCRSMEVTGSLARRERVCKTVGEWRRLTDLGNQNARDIVDYSRGRPSGQ